MWSWKENIHIVVEYANHVDITECLFYLLQSGIGDWPVYLAVYNRHLDVLSLLYKVSNHTYMQQIRNISIDTYM